MNEKKKHRRCLRCDKAIFTDENWRLCADCRSAMKTGEVPIPYEAGDYAGAPGNGPLYRKGGAE